MSQGEVFADNPGYELILISPGQVKTLRKMLVLCQDAEDCLAGAVLTHSSGCLSRRGRGHVCDCWLPVRTDVLARLRELLPLVEEMRRIGR